MEEITSYLADGQSVLLTGPRRVGKTSVVHRVLADMASQTRTLFIDAEDHASPTEMFAALATVASRDARVWLRIRRWFGKRLGDVVDRVETVDLGVLKVELQAAMAGSWVRDSQA